MNNKLKIGFLPTRRNVHGPKFCNLEVAQKSKNEIEGFLKSKKIDFVNLDFLNEEGLIYSVLDAPSVAKKFIAEDVDAIFAPHVNFGTEDAVAKVGKLVGKPFLLWGPRDKTPDSDDGGRYTDTQCGLFATGKVLKQYDVPFTYIINSDLTDDVFLRGFDSFMAVSAVVKSFKSLRIGQIGTRPQEFLSVKFNELELLERFGIEVVPITMIDLKSKFEDTLKNKSSKIDSEIEMWHSCCQVKINKDEQRRTAALKIAIRDWAEEEQLAAAVGSCWQPMTAVAGVHPCFTFADLTGEGFPVICEVDVHGAVSSIMAQAASLWTRPTFLADLTMRHPTNDNAELLWHCGVFPRHLAKDSKPALGETFDGPLASGGVYELKGGDITIARFDVSKGNYSLLMGHGKGIEGPATHGTYMWAEFKDWAKWERKFVEGPYIHHCTGIHGKYAPILFEACKYIDGLTPDPVDTEDCREG